MPFTYPNRYIKAGTTGQGAVSGYDSVAQAQKSQRVQKFLVVFLGPLEYVWWSLSIDFAFKLAN